MTNTLVGLIGILIVTRVMLWHKNHKKQAKESKNIGTAAFIGDMEVQADSYEILEKDTGVIVLLADGFGKDNLGKVASVTAVEASKTIYEQYKRMIKPQYIFTRAFNLANTEVLKQLEDRKGGTSLLTAFIDHNELIYALVGDIRLAIYRNGELVPLSEGHTINKLAAKAYKEGKINKQKVLWALKEERLWNYVGQDGFKEIELYDTPVRLKVGDKVLFMTKGIYQNISEYTIEKILGSVDLDVAQKAKAIIDKVQRSDSGDRENATVVIIQINEMKGV